MPATRDGKLWRSQFYYKDWQGVRRKKNKRGFKTKGEADEWERNFLQQQQKNLDISFENFVEIYFADMENRLRESTIINKRYVFDLKVTPYFKHKKMCEIQTSDIRAWQNELIKKGYAPTYLKSINNQLAALFNYAVRYYDLRDNPCRKAGSIGKSKADEMDFWTKQEFKEFLPSMDSKPEARMAFLLLYWTGMRIGELLALTYEDIDLEKRCITINKSYQRFYLTYRHSEKLAPMVREISWSNNIIIMEKCKDDLEREFYIQMAKRYGWTKRVLTNFVEARTYEKYLLNQTNFDLTIPEDRRIQAKLAVKDEYTFDFAELSPEYSEHELELQLVNNIRDFLIEMGGDFTFIGNQYHLMAGNRDLYIDLLLFHRRLRSLVAIELKIGEFEAEYAGKMQLYLTALDEQIKLPDENPSIGIIICKSKDKTYVEYALKNINMPIGVATYQLRNTLPEEMKEMLPEPEEIVKRLKVFEKL